MGSYGLKKGEGRCFFVLVKFIVIRKFFMGGEGIEGRGKKGWDERKKGREGGVRF